ncbi:MAG: response regulator [Bacteroidales bacterium]|nr:response regulator [Bacteroidales bacterium]
MQSKKVHESQILIVDDVPKNIQIVGNILSNEKLRIAYATNGENALKLAFANDFDLVLLDVAMPGMDGFEVCRRLRDNKKTAEIPIIFLTAKSDVDSMLTGFQAGAQDYVSKPFNAAELIARVRTHLELREKKHQLDQMNQILEEKVKARTIELEKANRQLSRLEKAKSEFLGIISHELRTPLNGIIGLTQLLALTEVNPEQKRYLEFLEQTSQRLARFSETALLITSLQADHIKVELFSASAEHLFSSVTDNLKHLILEKEIKIETELESPDIQIIADTDLINKSISILLENSINLLPKKGIIRLSVSTELQKTVIEISDNGKGFDEDVLSHLTNIDSKNATIVSEEVGLSIAAVRLIMDAHNGSLQIKNNPSGGACIRLIFDNNN